MAEEDLVDLETRVKGLPGVLGCVILTNADGTPSEIQAFVRMGTDTRETEQAIYDQLSKSKIDETPRHVFVFELEAAPKAGDHDLLQQVAEEAREGVTSEAPAVTAPDETDTTPAPSAPGAAPPPAGGLDHRPTLQRVALSSSRWNAEAEVALAGDDDEEVIGRAASEKTAHGLKVAAQATLDAAGKLIARKDFVLSGAALVSTLGREAVLVIVQVGGSGENLGAALVRHGSAAEAAVRATLDAVNRHLVKER